MLEITDRALLVLEKPKRQQFAYVDRKTRIVMRQRRAVQLGIVEFAIFYALHKHTDSRDRAHKTLTTKVLYEQVYSGVLNPPGHYVIAQTVHNVNYKLAHLGLKIVGVNRNVHSFYRLVIL